ncbi:hypothetical protein M441DRAFT_74863 [Trichoderma asperellum CBS 433.97]|uniref:Family A G protein-coupled receptor-like protein n=1 Tax=Trichoderma asperellum (strain ATCC 204424 / CBS 433.97 / NBRC 101777) TaxID=1042311 RepID=A0A2T3ZM88_TRIA4|nr:hypothetical protein M441DRAFT_74863 [Trichoderma asperellum CBS 433.97]PTB45920.1 hypothetical protein M441DRAFT_74863 [Trichoderma asperellum CBS 433.97]
MTLFLRVNDALNANPPFRPDETLSLAGSDWLWAVMAVHLLAFLILLIFCFTTPESDRVFHYLFTITLLVGTVSYYAEASDLGWSTVKQIDKLDNGSSRQLFYAKYINWAVAFPSVSLALGLLSNVSWTTIVTNIFVSFLWVVTYLAAAYTTSSYRWGFFTFGTLCWIILAMSTLNESREAASRIGLSRDYMILSTLANFSWVLYPIAFGLSDGGNVIGITGSFIFFGILDILAVPALALLFIILAGKWDYHHLHLAFSEHRYAPEDHGTALPKGSETASPTGNSSTA